MKTMKTIDSIYINADGDHVTIRTCRYRNGDVYVIYVAGWRVRQLTEKSAVRRYIVKNNCKPVG